MSISTHTHDDQFLRRTFDTLYEITPEHITNAYESIPQRVKYLLLTSIVALVIVWVYYQGAMRALEAVEWANRPTLATRADAPYDLMSRATPNLDPARLTLQEVRLVDQAAIQAARAALMERAEADALLVAQQAYELTIAAGQGIPAGEVVEGSEIPVVTVEQFMPALDAGAITSHVLPAVDVSYFRVLGDYPGYTRLHVNELVTVDPVQNCLMEIDAEVAPTCGLPGLPMFLEGADYLNAKGDVMRAVVARYESADEALSAIKALQRTTRQHGDLGNYSVAEITPVKWYFAVTNSGRSFIWSNGEWVYMVAAPTMSDVETFVSAFPH